MRRVLVDHARRRQAHKRGSGGVRITLDEALASYEERAVDMLALDEALNRLSNKDRELARLVELRFFAGLTTEETGRVLGLSVRQVEGAWVAARGWLRRELAEREAR
jgi:RNA polymerase sigma factor (TIGR02999 family)